MKPFSGSEMVIDINEFDDNWQKVAGQSFTMQKSFFNPHDFAVTKNYYVFFQNSMSFAMVRLCIQLARRRARTGNLGAVPFEAVCQS